MLNLRSGRRHAAVESVQLQPSAAQQRSLADNSDKTPQRLDTFLQSWGGLEGNFAQGCLCPCKNFGHLNLNSKVFKIRTSNRMDIIQVLCPRAARIQIRHCVSLHPHHGKEAGVFISSSNLSIKSLWNKNNPCICVCKVFSTAANLSGLTAGAQWPAADGSRAEATSLLGIEHQNSLSLFCVKIKCCVVNSVNTM